MGESVLDGGVQRWQENADTIRGMHNGAKPVPRFLQLLIDRSIRLYGRPTEFSLEAFLVPPRPSRCVEVAVQTDRDPAQREEEKAKRGKKVKNGPVPADFEQNIQKSYPLTGSASMTGTPTGFSATPSETLTLLMAAEERDAIDDTPEEDPDLEALPDPQVPPQQKPNKTQQQQQVHFVGEETQLHAQRPAGPPPVGSLPFDFRLGS
uniref:Uncharacterized protein n=1 Tax=Chromera velia CCMP2878 TaxID=1169474 RepID=A0A0G4I8N5_9ALVE|eukprot:Cvel_12008.t1-p1 / transcript=Cvel_12008.t1 / gene=Cvel_12008 / organism=Chromera_velia_CCMP2878 / gene_product=hypothetical protein / transcript_product=hypothetical protein / location=Cvel_scaffold771:16320-17697(-) / protein_length=206 / sequence_SO=supercontig / SO=protein_coding / is_pseudo=false